MWLCLHTVFLKNMRDVVELEMSPRHRSEPAAPRTKECPICGTECEVTATACHDVMKSFNWHSRQKTCHACESLTRWVQSCVACVEIFAHDVTVQLDDALRHGAIVRGMEVEEEEVVLGETLAPQLEKKVLRSGDEFLINLLRTVPEESYGRLARMMGDIK